MAVETGGINYHVYPDLANSTFRLPDKVIEYFGWRRVVALMCVGIDMNSKSILWKDLGIVGTD